MSAVVELYIGEFCLPDCVLMPYLCCFDLLLLLFGGPSVWLTLLDLLTLLVPTSLPPFS
jgi:hypothetical protein